MSKQKDRIFVLKHDLTPLAYILPSVDKPKNRLLHFDAEKDQERALRYARNEKTPYIDEQGPNAILDAIIFSDGVLTVPHTKPALIKFLEVHPLKDEVFEEFDPEKHAELAMIKEDLILDALVKVREMDVEELKMALRTLTDLPVADLSSAEIKLEAKLLARRYPEDFLSIFDNPEIELDNFAVLALEDGFIGLRNKGKELFYNTAEKKSRIMVIPHGKLPAEALTDWFKTDEGSEFYTFIQKQYEVSE